MDRGLSPRAPVPLSRRTFLRRSAALAAGAGAWNLVSGRVLDAAAAPSFPNPLRFPTELTGSDITLRARVSDLQIRPGAKTTMWVFNDEFPGPTIRRPAGESTTVSVHHELSSQPIRGESITVHLHGGHTASRFDGQPGGGAGEYGFGQSFEYRYELMEDGLPERGALQWYHDHSHFRTGRNVWMGLAGMFLVTDDAVDEALGLPVGPHDLPLLVTDRLFDAANQLIFPLATGDRRPPAGPGAPPFADAIGTTILVNGTERPHLVVEPRAYRFRILNASNLQPYNFAIPAYGPLTQVGTESGLLPVPVVRESVLLGPAERAEIVVDFSGRAGQTLLLRSVPRLDAGRIPSTRPAIADVLELRVDTSPSVPPASALGPLRPLPDWVGEVDGEVDRVWTFGLGADERGTAWTINGRTFDHERIDAFPELDSVETWMFVNTSPTLTSHYIHIHDVDWLVLSRNGEPPGPGEDGLKETFRLDPGEVVVVASKFTDHLGRYMIHCHMLEHEDHGMMTAFEVVEPGRGDLANPVPGVTSVADEVATRVAGERVVVSLAQVRSPDRDRARAVLAAQLRRPGQPAPVRDASASEPVAPLYCDLTQPPTP